MSLPYSIFPSHPNPRQPCRSLTSRVKELKETRLLSPHPSHRHTSLRLAYLPRRIHPYTPRPPLTKITSTLVPHCSAPVDSGAKVPPVHQSSVASTNFIFPVRCQLLALRIQPLPHHALRLLTLSRRSAVSRSLLSQTPSPGHTHRLFPTRLASFASPILSLKGRLSHSRTPSQYLVPQKGGSHRAPVCLHPVNLQSSIPSSAQPKPTLRQRQKLGRWPDIARRYRITTWRIRTDASKLSCRPRPFLLQLLVSSFPPPPPNISMPCAPRSRLSHPRLDSARKTRPTQFHPSNRST